MGIRILPVVWSEARKKTVIWQATGPFYLEKDEASD